MPVTKILSRLFLILLISVSLAFGGCSMFGSKDEDDLTFDEDFLAEEESIEEPASATAKASGSEPKKEDGFFSDDKIAKGEGFASVDQATDIGELQADVEGLQVQQEALISKIRELEEMIRTLEPRVNATQQRLEDTLASEAVKSETIDRDVEEIANKIAERDKARSKSGSTPVAVAAGKNTKTASKKQPAPAAKKKSAPKVAAVPPRKKASAGQYKNALKAYRTGNYDESILLFQEYSMSNPPNDLRDNVQFWIGNNYLKLEMFDDAIKQYQTVLRKYPKGNKVHDSRYMIGMSYFRKGDTGRALDVLETALKSNPPLDVRKKIEKLLMEIQ